LAATTYRPDQWALCGNVTALTRDCATVGSVLARMWGIVRSLAIYHGQPGRHRRLRRFYAQFLRPGDLGFDVGAHVGNRVRAWRSLGARVVAIEPQPDLVRVLRVLFGRDPDVVVLPQAVGAHGGRESLRIATATPTVSSLSPTWMGTVAADRRFGRVRWDRTVEVEVVTLDDLVMAYGTPSFCKVDVEGFEAEVLSGLSSPVTALSFEYLPPAHEAGMAALAQVERLGAAVGGYEYNYSSVETLRFAAEEWLDAAGLERLLDRIRSQGRSGDVYARLIAPG
jgi:FkbM family methyltransferase